MNIWTVISSVISFVILQHQMLRYYSPSWDCDPGLFLMVAYSLLVCFPIYMLGASVLRMDNGMIGWVRREDRRFPKLPFVILALSATTTWIFSHKSMLRNEVPVIYEALYDDDSTPRSIALRMDGSYKVRVDNDCSGYELYGTYTLVDDTICLETEDFRWDHVQWHCNKCMVITSDGFLREYDAEPGSSCYMRTVIDKR